MIDKNNKILIIGLGLIGGSYARALTKKGYSVWAIDNNSSSIEYALENKIIEKGSSFVDETLVLAADIIVFALYPKIFIEWVKENKNLFKKGTLLTDVTGVKGSAVKEIQSILPNGVEFIAAHPMAGRERYGVENSDESIFNGANYIVVPSDKNSEEAIQTCKELGRILGFAQVSVLSIEKHDQMIAFLSQLTHCIAICLMTCLKEENLEKYTGDSFRDLTRIANINENMWSELFMLNRGPLIDMMQLFIDDFETLKKYIEAQDVEAVKEMMRISTARRKLFDKPKGE